MAIRIKVRKKKFIKNVWGLDNPSITQEHLG